MISIFLYKPKALSNSIFIFYSLGGCGEVVRLLAAVAGPRLIGGRPQVGAGVHQRAAAAAAARIRRGHQILGYYAGIRLADVGLVLTTANPRVGGGGDTGIVVGGMIGLGHTAAAAGWIGLARHTAAAHVGLGAAVEMGCRGGCHYGLCAGLAIKNTPKRKPKKNLINLLKMFFFFFFFFFFFKK
jgi:hypothetical protein